MVVLLALYLPSPSGFGLCLIAAFLSDVFDGILARRLGVATPTLRRLDSIADSVFYLAAVFAAITGILSALLGKSIFDPLRIPKNVPGWMARGFALGTAGHGVGAARAIQVNPDAGALAGLALGLQVLLASILIPLIYRWSVG